MPSGDAEIMERSGTAAERFDVGGLAAAVGSRAKVLNGDNPSVVTRVDFVHGNTVATVFIIDTDGTADHVDEVAVLATAFEQRLTDILGT